MWRFWKICNVAILIIILLYWMYGGVLILLVLLVTLIGALYHYQDSLLYYPEQPESAHVFVQLPSSMGLPYETTFLTTKSKLPLTSLSNLTKGQAPHPLWYIFMATPVTLGIDYKMLSCSIDTVGLIYCQLSIEVMARVKVVLQRQVL